MDGSSTFAIDTTSPITEINATNNAGTTLAGADGQIKMFLNTSSSKVLNDATITPTNLRGHTSIVLSGEGKTVGMLMFKSGGWFIIQM